MKISNKILLKALSKNKINGNDLLNKSLQELKLDLNDPNNSLLNLILDIEEIIKHKIPDNEIIYWEYVGDITKSLDKLFKNNPPKIEISLE